MNDLVFRTARKEDDIESKCKKIIEELLDSDWFYDLVAQKAADNRDTKVEDRIKNIMRVIDENTK